MNTQKLIEGKKKELQELLESFNEDIEETTLMFDENQWSSRLESFLVSSLTEIAEQAYKEGQACKGKANREFYQRGYKEGRETLFTEIDEIKCLHCSKPIEKKGR